MYYLPDLPKALSAFFALFPIYFFRNCLNTYLGILCHACVFLSDVIFSHFLSLLSPLFFAPCVLLYVIVCGTWPAIP